MKYLKYAILILFVSLSSMADMPGSTGITARFLCDGGDSVVTPNAIEEIAIQDVIFSPSQLTSSGFSLSLVGNQISLGQILLGLVDPSKLQCIDDHNFTYLTPVTPVLDVNIGETVTYTSSCYPSGENLDGVANWARDQHVELFLSQDARIPEDRPNRLYLTQDRVRTFPHLDLCQQAK